MSATPGSSFTRHGAGTFHPPVAELETTLSDADRVVAERLIRATIQQLAGGVQIKDVDELVRRNLGTLTHADIMAGRLNSNVLGDVINTVEKAKETAPFNFSAATHEQIANYLASKGINPSVMAYWAGGTPRTPGGGSGNLSGNATVLNGGQPNSGTYASGLVANFGINSYGVMSGMTPQLFTQQFQPVGFTTQRSANNVANILANREHLRGGQLVERTKQVANDTRHGMGLNVDHYAPLVANIGKRNSDPIVHNVSGLREGFNQLHQGNVNEFLNSYRNYRENEERQVRDARNRGEPPDIVRDIQTLNGDARIEMIRKHQRELERRGVIPRNLSPEQADKHIQQRTNTLNNTQDHREQNNTLNTTEIRSTEGTNFMASLKSGDSTSPLGQRTEETPSTPNSQTSPMQITRNEPDKSNGTTSTSEPDLSPTRTRTAENNTTTEPGSKTGGGGDPPSTSKGETPSPTRTTGNNTQPTPEPKSNHESHIKTAENKTENKTAPQQPSSRPTRQAGSPPAIA